MKELIRRTRELLQPKKESFRREKFVADIRQGFRITADLESSVDSFAEAVTRNGDDLFFVEASFGGIPESEAYEGYLRMNMTVRRRRAFPGEKGAATLERWSKQETSLAQDFDGYRIQKDRGGELSENEFWRRYNASTVDRAATLQYFELRKAEIEKSYGARARITSEQEIGAETARKLLGPDTK